MGCLSVPSGLWTAPRQRPGRNRRVRRSPAQESSALEAPALKAIDLGKSLLEHLYGSITARTAKPAGMALLISTSSGWPWHLGRPYDEQVFPGRTFAGS